jgi:hypothetical protein
LGIRVFDGEITKVTGRAERELIQFNIRVSEFASQEIFGLLPFQTAQDWSKKIRTEEEFLIDKVECQETRSRGRSTTEQSIQFFADHEAFDSMRVFE